MGRYPCEACRFLCGGRRPRRPVFIKINVGVGTPYRPVFVKIDVWDGILAKHADFCVGDGVLDVPCSSTLARRERAG